MEFYRYETRSYASMDSDGEYGYSSLRYPNISLELRTYELIKETPKGYWIGWRLSQYRDDFYFKKWVPKISKKRFAYPTKEEALTNYVKRTEKRIQIMNSQIRDCRWGLHLAEDTRKRLLNEKTQIS